MRPLHRQGLMEGRRADGTAIYVPRIDNDCGPDGPGPLSELPPLPAGFDAADREKDAQIAVERRTWSAS